MYLSSQYSQSQASEDSCLISARQQSSRFSLNEQPTYGIYNRNDFMARCYRKSWKVNSRIGPELKKLLCFGGQTSLSGDCCSTFLFVFILVFPLLSLGLLFPSKTLSKTSKVTISSVMMLVLLLICFWHLYSIIVIIQNKKKWINSWFVCKVTEDKIMPHSKHVGKRFFDIRQHMKFFDVTRHSLAHFPLLTKFQKESLYQKFNFENMNRARLILYTARFIESSADSTLKIAVLIFFMTVVCTGVSLYEVVLTIRKL